MAKIFIKIFNFFNKRKYFLYIFLIAIIAFATFPIININIEEDISNFLPKNKKNEQINEIYQNINSTNKIFIFVKNSATTSSDKENITEAISFLAEELTANDSLKKIKSILYEIDSEKANEITSFITKNIPLYLDDNDYKRIDSIICKEKIEQQLENDKNMLLMPTSGFIRNVIVDDPLFFSKNILEKLKTVQTNDNFISENGYIFDSSENAAVLILTPIFSPSDTYNNKLLAKDIDNAINKVEKKYNSVKITSFGAPLISVTNADQIKIDSIWTGILAIVLILAILIYYYRNLYDIFLIFVSILFGFFISLSIVLLTKSTISIIIIGIATVIIGIAINYPLHLIAHYKEVKNKEQLIKEIISPLLIGNITTVAAFASLIFLSSDSMQSLGLFASILLIATIFFVIIFLPHFLKKKKLTTEIEKEEKSTLISKITNISPEKNKFFVLLIFILSLIFFVFSFGTSFEPDMHSINYMTKEQKAIMEHMSKGDKNIETILSFTEAEDDNSALLAYNEANKYFDTLKNDKLIENISSINDFVLSKEVQEEKIDKWNNFWESRKDTFLINFDEIAKKQNFNENAFSNFKDIINADYSPQDISHFKAITENFGENFISHSSNKTYLLTLLKVKKDLSDSVENKINTFDNKTFCFDNSNFFKSLIETLSDDFNYILFVCSFIVFAFLLISFGRIELSIIAFLPLALAWFWILGIMNIFDIKFNIINIILATFIFGQGDDYTIFITEGLIYEYTYGKKFLQSFKNSIFLSFLIMIIAIGLLVFAKHPALQSLGEVTIIGMVSVLIMAFIVPPFFYKFLTTNGQAKRLMPITLWNFIKTIFSLIVFLLGTIYITIVGFFLLTIGGKTKKNKEKFHVILCNIFRFIRKLIPGVSYTSHNPTYENFEKPAIIISNHQSHLDLLYTLALNPKIIVLTNDWVWNNMIYGIIIRYADYLPINDDMEKNVEKLKEKTDEGYSILIFPEGTRSEDCSIRKFHQGAFYLADMLNLDIVPVLLHGIGHFFPKKEFILRKGNAHIEILKRISHDELFKDNSTTLEIAKKMRRYYSFEYFRVAKNIENYHYFKDLVYKNYIYKGREISNQAKKALKSFNYKEIDNIPDNGKILIKNCSNGEISLIIALIKKEAQIFAFDEDETKLSIAKNCISVPKNLNYISDIDISQNFDYIIEL